MNNTLSIKSVFNGGIEEDTFFEGKRGKYFVFFKIYITHYE